VRFGHTSRTSSPSPARNAAVSDPHLEGALHTPRTIGPNRGARGPDPVSARHQPDLRRRVHGRAGRRSPGSDQRSARWTLLSAQTGCSTTPTEATLRRRAPTRPETSGSGCMTRHSPIYRGRLAYPDPLVCKTRHRPAADTAMARDAHARRRPPRTAEPSTAAALSVEPRSTGSSCDRYRGLWSPEVACRNPEWRCDGKRHAA